jgi:hypothetical protein
VLAVRVVAGACGADATGNDAPRMLGDGRLAPRRGGIGAARRPRAPGGGWGVDGRAAETEETGR